MTWTTRSENQHGPFGVLGGTVSSANGPEHIARRHLPDESEAARAKIQTPYPQKAGVSSNIYQPLGGLAKSRPRNLFFFQLMPTPWFLVGLSVSFTTFLMHRIA